MIYEVLFKDKTTYRGKDYFNTGWTSMPDKPIRQISVRLPDGCILTLPNCESYNHFIEATKDVKGGDQVGKIVLRNQYLMGKLGDKVISYRISLYESKDSKYKVGDITRRLYDYGKEYSGSSTSGWKLGVTK